ncbi:hypothetical protein ACOSQ3_030647 [Xanthoceras sorbifolium]
MLFYSILCLSFQLLSSVLWLADQSFAAELTELLQLHTSKMSFLMIGSWRLTSISSEHRFYLQRGVYSMQDVIEIYANNKVA